MNFGSIELDGTITSFLLCVSPPTAIDWFHEYAGCYAKVFSDGSKIRLLCVRHFNLSTELKFGTAQSSHGSKAQTYFFD
jgi:hypothetical protein